MIAVLKEAENDRAAALDATGRDCKSIEGAAERLACFDSAKAPNLNETNGSVGLSNWRSTIEKSELTDSLNVILSVTSEDVVSCGRVTEQSAILVVRCTEDTTAIFVSTDCQLASGFQGYGNVEYRVDDNSMGKAAMDVDTSSTSLGLWSGASAIPLIKKILGGKDLILRFTPYNSIPVTVKFSIEGFNEAIVPLRRQCGW